MSIRAAVRGLLTFGLLLSFAAVQAAEKDDCAAIVAKAIEAQGGKEKLAKHNAIVWKESGTYYGMGDGLPYTGNYAVQHPDKFKMEIEGVFTIVFNGDKGWVKDASGVVKPFTKEQVAEYKQSANARYVATLLPLLGKDYELSPAGETKIKEEPAVAIKVSRKGYDGVTLYFDKKTNLLAKVHSKVKAEELGGKEVDDEVMISQYKEIDGVKHLMKYVLNRDGKKFVEAELSELKPAEKLDEATFGKP